MSTRNDEHEMLAPSDRELMRFYDGELDEASAAEIERWLADDPAARDKRAGLSLAGELLREVVDGDDRSEGIADAVMAHLDDELDELDGLEDLFEDDDALEDDAAPDAAPEAAPTAAGPEVAPTAGSEEVIRASTSSGPANDNARTIFGLAAVAAAVAVGLFVWGQTAPEGPVASAPGSPPALEEPTAIPAPAPAPPAAAGAPESADDASEDTGVQVAAVDFGSQSGSVFYVAGHTAQTAVVWVSDGGEEP